MSPYQQEVIDTTLAEFDRQQAIADTALRDRAIQAGAFGGGREGVLAAEAARGAQMNRANLQANLLAQGFQQAQAAAAADLAARQGLGTYQSQLGQQQQAVEQAKLDAAQIAAKEEAISTIHTIRIGWSTTSTDSTRSISYTNRRYRRSGSTS